MSGITFFPQTRPLALQDLAVACGAELLAGHEAATVDGIAPLEDAKPGSLTFLNNRRYARLLTETRAAAVIVSKDHAAQVPDHVAALVAPDPYRAFAIAAATLYPTAMRPLPVFGPGIAAGAHIHPDAVLEDDVTVEPGAVIGARAFLGRGCHIGPGAVVGADVTVGRDTTICANATVVHAMLGDRCIIHSGVRLGSDGFGFAMGAGGHAKIPQIGRTVVQDDVEIGPNTVIDRGSNRDTIIGEGSKIDGAIMIGHNVTIGRHCVLAGQCGVAGSTDIGDYVLMGAGVSVNGHITVGSGAQFMAKTVIVSDIPAGVQYAGDPARPIGLWRRDMATARRDWKSREKTSRS